MQRLHNHKKRIIKSTPIMVTKVIPGLFVEFKYSKARSDRLPLVLVLANGKNEQAVNSKTKTLLHGINLNYLSDYYIDKMAHGLTETKMQGEYYEIETAERDQRGRFVKPEESRTQLNIPTLNEARTAGMSFSQAELRQIVKDIYDEIKDDVLKKVDAYRTYDISEISDLKTILYKFPPRRVY